MTHVSVLAPVPATPATLSINGRDRRILHQLQMTSATAATVSITLNGDTEWTVKLSAGTITLPMADTPYRSVEFATDAACTIVAFTSLRA